MASAYAKTVDGIGRGNTKIYNENGHFAVQLHQTVIFDEDRANGKLTLNNGGWVTPTTARRMNQALAHRGCSNRVAIRKGEMVLLCTRSVVPFQDGKLVIELQRVKQCNGADHQYNPVTMTGACVECGGMEPKEVA